MDAAELRYGSISWQSSDSLSYGDLLVPDEFRCRARQYYEKYIKPSVATVLRALVDRA